MFNPVRLAAILFLFVCGPAAAAPPGYTVTALPISGATSINNYGHVVGTHTLPDGAFHGVLYRDGAVIDLGTLGGTNSRASGINDRGDVVGWSETATESRRAFIYSSGVMRDLGIPLSTASDINNQAQIVGTANGVAFLLHGDTFTSLGTLGGSGSSAYAISETGIIVGEAMTGASGDTVHHAFLYSGGSMQDLGTLEEGRSSYAFAVNAHGQAVGRSDMPLLNYRGFLYDGDLDKLPTFGGDYSTANGINDVGYVVGAAMDGTGQDRAFLFADGTLHDLNDLIDEDCGCFLSFAGDINDVGQILASGTLDGEQRSFILTPVPEPSAVSVLLAFVIVSLRRRT